MLQRACRSIAFLAVLFAWVATADATTVQIKTGTITNNTALTIAVDAVGAGNALVVVQRHSAIGVTSTTPTETGGSDTWVRGCGAIDLIGTVPSNAGNNMAVWYVQSATAGVTAVTLNVTGNAIIQAAVYEISGQAASMFDDCQFSALDNTGTALEITNGSGITPTTNSSLVIAAYSTVANKVFTQGAGYVIQATQTRFIAEDKTSSSTDAETGPASISVSGAWVGLIFNLKLSSNAPPTIQMNTLTGATFTTLTPAIRFTCTDPDGDGCRYQIIISNSSNYTAAGDLLTDNNSSIGSLLPIHNGPDTYNTAQGPAQTDDRLCGSFTASTNGLLGKIAWYCGNDPNLPPPDDPNGNLLSRVYTEAHLTAYGTDSYPLNPACAIGSTSCPGTPTLGWLAQSDNVPFTSSMSVGNDWRETPFSSTNRIVLTPGAHYFACNAWDVSPANPPTPSNDNTIACQADTGKAHAGNIWIDGDSPNYGHDRLATLDAVFRIYEYQTLLDKISGTDAGFTGSGGEPYASGQEAVYTVQVDALYAGDWHVKVRAKDPNGSNTNSSYTSDITITISDGEEEEDDTSCGRVRVSGASACTRPNLGRVRVH